MIATNVSKTRFEKLYRSENDANVKERMLLVLNVVYDKQIPAQVARDLHRSKTWASDWLKRYREEGIEGLKNRTKSGRPHQTYQKRQSIRDKKRIIIEPTGMDYKTDRRSDCKKERWNKIPLHSHMSPFTQVGIQTEGTHKGTCKNSNKRREETF